MDRLVHGDRNGCVSAFHQAIQLIKTGEMTPDASIEAFVHWFYGVALRAMGEGSKAEEQLRTGRSRLEGAGLKGQLIIAEQAEPQLVDFLRQTYASERASVQG
jgi:hypothetical protein